MTEPEAVPRGAGGRSASPPRRGPVVVVLVAGIALLAVSLHGAVVELLPRQFTAGQQQQIMAWEVGKRWRSWPVGEIFPSAVRYQVPGGSLAASSGLSLTAYRVGIGHQAACAAATDRAAGQVLDAHGCTALLRASYADATGAYVTTVGIAVLPSSQASVQARDALTGRGSRGPGSSGRGSPGPGSSGRGRGSPGPGSSGRATSGRGASSLALGGQGTGVRALAVRGTVAAGFGDAQRQLSSVLAAGPYLIMYATGYTDGRPREPLQPGQYAESEMASVSVGVADSIASRIGAPPPVPHCPGASAC